MLPITYTLHIWNDNFQLFLALLLWEEEGGGAKLCGVLEVSVLGESRVWDLLHPSERLTHFSDGTESSSRINGRFIAAQSDNDGTTWKSMNEPMIIIAVTTPNLRSPPPSPRSKREETKGKERTTHERTTTVIRENGKSYLCPCIQLKLFLFKREDKK